MIHTHTPGKNKRKFGLISLVVVCAMALAITPNLVFATESPVVQQGENGGCVWEKTEDGTLTVKPKEGGNGQLKDMDFVKEADPNGNKNRVFKIVFSEGVKAPENMYQAFYLCKYVQEINLNNLDTSKTTNMGEMFKDCGSLKSIKLKEIDTSNVTDMHELFYGCQNLPKITIKKWNLNKVTNMNSMFKGCYLLQEMNLPGNISQKLSNVTDMGSMFAGCHNLAKVEFCEKIDTSNVVDMSYMFDDCQKLTDIKNVDKFNTSNVQNMDHMFNSCISLKGLDLYKWNTANVTNMNNMFASCSNLKHVMIGEGFDTSNVTSMAFMFYRDANLSGLNVSKFNTAKVADMEEMFSSCSNLKNLDVSNWDTAACKNTKLMFKNCTGLTELDLGKWNLNAAKKNNNHYEGMFEGCQLKALNVGFDIPQADGEVMTPGDPFAGKVVVKNGKKSAGVLMWMEKPEDRFGIWAVEGYEPTEKLVQNAAQGPVAPAADAYAGKQGADLKVTIKTVNFEGQELKAADVIATNEGVNTVSLTGDITNDIVFEGVVAGPQGLDDAIGPFDTLNGVVVLDEAGTEVKDAVSVKATGIGTAGFESERGFKATVKASALEAGKSYTLKFKSTFGACDIKANPSDWYGDAHSLGADVDFKLNVKPALGTVTFTATEEEGKKVLTIGSSKGAVAEMTTDSIKELDAYKADTKVIRVAQGTTIVCPEDCSNMFKEFRAVEVIDLKGFDTSRTQNMANMFWFCEKAQSIDVSSFDTSHVVDMTNMFNGCVSLESLDLSNFNTASVQKAGGVFGFGLPKLQKVVLSENFKADAFAKEIPFPRDWDKVQSGETVVAKADFFAQDSVAGTWTKHVVVEEPKAVAETHVIEGSNVEVVWNKDEATLTIRKAADSKEDTASVDGKALIADIAQYKELAKKVVVADKVSVKGSLDNHETADLAKNEKNAGAGLFDGFANLESVDIAKLDVSAVDGLGWMFRGCEKLKSVDVSTLDTSNVTFMVGMFENCKALESLDLKNFKTDKVTNMGWMFAGCENIKNLDLTSFNTSSVIGMRGMFVDCHNLESVNTSSFDTTNVKTMRSMFEHCFAVRTLDLNNFSTPNLLSAYAMFNGCSSCEYLNLAQFDLTHLDVDHAEMSGMDSMFGYAEGQGNTNTQLKALKSFVLGPKTTFTHYMDKHNAGDPFAGREVAWHNGVKVELERVNNVDFNPLSQIEDASGLWIIDPEMAPKVAVLDNNLSSAATIRIDMDLAKFKAEGHKVVLNGKTLVEDEDYVLTEGSVIITLKDNVVSKLDDAKNDLVVQNKDGEELVAVPIVLNTEDKNNIKAVAQAREDARAKINAAIEANKDDAKKVESLNAALAAIDDKKVVDEITAAVAKATAPKDEATAPKEEAPAPKEEAPAPKEEAAAPKEEAAAPKDGGQSDDKSGNKSDDNAAGNKSDDSAAGNKSDDKATGDKSDDSAAGNKSDDKAADSNATGDKSGNKTESGKGAQTGSKSTATQTGSSSTTASTSTASKNTSSWMPSYTEMMAALSKGNVNPATAGTASSKAAAPVTANVSTQTPAQEKTEEKAEAQETVVEEKVVAQEKATSSKKAVPATADATSFAAMYMTTLVGAAAIAISRRM